MTEPELEIRKKIKQTWQNNCTVGSLMKCYLYHKQSVGRATDRDEVGSRRAIPFIVLFYKACLGYHQ